MLNTLPSDRPVHSGTNLTSLGSILATQQLRAKTKSLTFPRLSIAKYSFIQLSTLRYRGENENALGKERRQTVMMRLFGKNRNENVDADQQSDTKGQSASDMIRRFESGKHHIESKANQFALAWTHYVNG